MESRISSATYFNQGLAGMSTAQGAVAKAMQEISSGKRTITPASDPSGSVSLVHLDRSLSQLQQYQRNGDAADARLGTTENALQGMQDVANRAIELSMQFNNDIHDDVSRQALRDDFGQLRDQMLSLMNTRDEHGDYIFSGSEVETQPYALDGASYVYKGDAASLHLAVGDGVSIQSGWAGSELFDGTDNVLLDTLNQLATGTETTPNQADLESVNKGLERLIIARAQVGVSMNAASMTRASNDGQIYGYTQLRSNLQDTDYASAITELNKQTLALQATQSTLARVQGLSLFNEL